MTADLGIDRAHVQAGRTPDAAQHLAKFGIGQNPAAPIVQDYQVKLLWAVDLIRLARSADIADIGGHLLCRSPPAQQPQQHIVIFQAGGDPLHAHERHMDFRQSG